MYGDKPLVAFIGREVTYVLNSQETLAYGVQSAPASLEWVYSETSADLEATLPGVAITGATNASPIVIATVTAHGLANGALVTISGVGGNTAANANFLVTVINPTTVSLNNSAGNGAYTGGGTISQVLKESKVSQDANGAPGTWH
ncbi:MAG TPA: ubiquitin-activating E1 FCCH domain-containing protein [Candidatus Acidoferrales bacterium]|nr:ubiquitin-activating E1 FCCH domain-containing protein [Candidatus Acidoferrales bacterium]